MITLTKEEMWEAIVQANNLLLDALPLDPKHQVSCHADTLPQVFLQLALAAQQAIDLLQEPIQKQVVG